MHSSIVSAILPKEDVLSQNVSSSSNGLSGNIVFCQLLKLVVNLYAAELILLQVPDELLELAKAAAKAALEEMDAD